MKRAVVTGATSFIGIALIKELIKANYEVIAIIRPSSLRKTLLWTLCPKIKLIECELNQLNRAELNVEQCNVLFHIGWASDFSNSRYNLEGQMRNVKYCEYSVELAARYGCEAYLCVGSQAECGVINEPITSYTKENPMTAYAEAKCIANTKTKDFCKIYGIKHYWPRLLSAYGPYDRNTTMIMSCIQACRDRKILKLTPAEQIWDFVYVENVAKALLAIVEKGNPIKRYPIASGTGKELKEYIADIAKIMDFPEILKGIGQKNYTENQVMYLVGDIKELQNDTGVCMDYDFEQGIRDIVKLFINPS
ncbi:MAG: NAD-dependent epimerase/dehydratase [Lachnospiraceae bacterium]|nr:NAD-dependent epimerase/dehydratase [Lachnospiraceae bacterium]MDE7201688.1 NAD-dependent epimerase/dehydratase [Lachnospiraceae bacterium]